MADDDERERQTEPEITSEENAIEEDELELSLGLRPVHPRPRFLASSLLSKRDVHALRRQEAKKKRDLKRKANNTRACLAAEEREGNSGDSQPLDDAGNCRKAPKINASYWAPPSWWSWNPAAGAGEGFRPYQGQNGKFNPGMQNGEAKDCENRQSISSGSSSGISDNYQSTSGPGGTSSDVGSHSSHPYSQPSPPTIPTGSPCRVSQGELEPNGSNRDQTEPTMSSRRSSKPFDNGPSSDKGPISATPNPGPKEVKVEKGKPPKPTGPTTNQPKELTLAQMPCVSVTGNGPNGKTITGFLYRYTKGEVSIVCVCHGTSFSPAGFVEHAGGADVENPLRHIRVVPFALG